MLFKPDPEKAFKINWKHDNETVNPLLCVHSWNAWWSEHLTPAHRIKTYSLGIHSVYFYMMFNWIFNCFTIPIDNRASTDKTKFTYNIVDTLYHFHRKMRYILRQRKINDENRQREQAKEREGAPEWQSEMDGVNTAISRHYRYAYILWISIPYQNYFIEILWSLFRFIRISIFICMHRCVRHHLHRRQRRCFRRRRQPISFQNSIRFKIGKIIRVFWCSHTVEQCLNVSSMFDPNSISLSNDLKGIPNRFTTIH